MFRIITVVIGPSGSETGSESDLERKEATSDSSWPEFCDETGVSSLRSLEKEPPPSVSALKQRHRMSPNVTAGFDSSHGRGKDLERFLPLLLLLQLVWSPMSMNVFFTIRGDPLRV